MDTYRTLLVDAFASDPLAGTVAGVVPDADGLTAEQMRAVARELGASETAFVLPSGSADRRLRYFTPTREVDRCGHATVAAHAHLHEAGVVDADDHTVETSAGVLDVEIDGGVVWMRQDAPEVSEVSLDYDRLGSALGVDPAALRDVGADLPPAVASTGLPFLCVPVNFLEHLSGADPDVDALADVAADHDAAGVYVFTFDALDGDSTLHARCFGPGRGVGEDPVTGTASGACAAYLRHVGAFDDAATGDGGSTPDELRFEQGHFLDRPGRVHVRFDGGVWVGGRAVTSLDGTLAVPPDEDDGIIEA
jgi:PhzF family phenazine biosynthesis protein